MPAGKGIDDNEIPKHNCHSQHNGYGNTIHDIGHHHMEKCVKFACAQHLRRFDELVRANAMEVIANPLIDIRQNDNHIGRNQQENTIVKGLWHRCI